MTLTLDKYVVYAILAAAVAIVLIIYAARIIRLRTQFKYQFAPRYQPPLNEDTAVHPETTQEVPWPAVPPK